MTALPIRVLLVEDNPGDADLTIETLGTGRVLVDIDVASDGSEALARLQEAAASGNLPDLVLLDLNLPGMNGKELLRTIRSDAKMGALPVVVLTSSDAERDIAESYRLGANCYVSKPVGLEAFRTIVRSIEGFWFTIVRLP